MAGVRVRLDPLQAKRILSIDEHGLEESVE